MTGSTRPIASNFGTADRIEADDGHYWVRLWSLQAIRREGEAMRNCLANGLSRPYAELPGGGTRPAARAAAAPAPARKPAQPAVVPAANSANPKPVQPAAGESSAR